MGLFSAIMRDGKIGLLSEIKRFFYDDSFILLGTRWEASIYMIFSIFLVSLKYNIRKCSENSGVKIVNAYTLLQIIQNLVMFSSSIRTLSFNYYQFKRNFSSSKWLKLSQLWYFYKVFICVNKIQVFLIFHNSSLRVSLIGCLMHKL